MKRFPSLLLVLLAACSDPGATRTGAADAAVADAIPDIGGDTGATDTTADTEADAEPDTALDTISDTETDTAADTEADTTADTEADAEPDTALDTEADTTADTDADTEVDTTADTEVDAEFDATADTETADTQADVEADTTADTAADTSEPDTAADVDTIADTMPPAACGDGLMQPGEDCDNGAANSDATPDGCRTDCRAAYCGDGVVDASETCDDGNAEVDGCPYGGASCTVCGTTCRSTAGRVRVCGDGTLDAEEICDDGNTITELCVYGELACTVCSSTCIEVAGEVQACGNGAVEAGESCDDGLLNDDLTADACRTDCSLPTCGDGTRDSAEACDDGNLSDRDQCSSLCELGLGRACAPEGVNSDCLSGWCSNGFCAPAGMAYIPSGTFLMGSPDTEFGRNASDENLHEVTLTRPFYMDLTETTQASWRELAGPSGNPSFYDGMSPCNSVAPDSCPVESLGSTTIAIYANARSEDEGLTACYTLSGCSQTLTGGTWQNGTYTCTGMVLASLDCNGYRLPTEAEWEYAYRAGSSTSLYNGDATTDAGVDPLAELIATYIGNVVRSRPSPVGQHLPNAWGLYDIAGNVQEWVEDRYLARLPAATDPLQLTGSLRVMRGGFYNASAAGIRAAYRIKFGINLRDSATGFRLVRTVTPANLR